MDSKYPEHEHPEGSSKKVLPNISAEHSASGRWQEFTVGSRSVKPKGIAAKGSQLEASAMSMKPRKRKK